MPIGVGEAREDADWDPAAAEAEDADEDDDDEEEIEDDQEDDDEDEQEESENEDGGAAESDADGSAADGGEDDDWHASDEEGEEDEEEDDDRDEDEDDDDEDEDDDESADASTSEAESGGTPQHIVPGTPRGAVEEGGGDEDDEDDDDYVDGGEEDDDDDEEDEEHAASAACTVASGTAGASDTAPGAEPPAEAPAAIARRTRAQLSLETMELEALEAALIEPSPRASPRRARRYGSDDEDEGDEEDEGDWRDFLMGIRQRAEEEEDEDEDQEDQDYVYAADETRLHEVEEEFADLENPIDELREVVNEQTKRSERHPHGGASGTGADGRGSPLGRLLPRPYALGDGRASPLGRGPALRPAGALGLGGLGGGGVGAAARHPMAGGSTSPTPSLTSHGAHPGGPGPAGTGAIGGGSSGGSGGGARVAGAVAGAPLTRPFSAEKLRTLQIQMHVHMQLLVQTLVIARAAMKQEPHFAQVALLAYSLLTELCTHCDVTIAHKQLRTRPKYATPLQLTGQLAGAATGGAGGAAGGSAPPTRLRQLLGGTPTANASMLSIFHMPGFHLLPELLTTRCGLKRVYDADTASARDSAARAVGAETFDAKAELARFAPFFNRHYGIRRDSTSSGGGAPAARFSAAEDNLLATGLMRYGPERFEAIRAFLLPCKSVTALRKRYEARSARRAEPNPIKRARLDCALAQLGRAEIALVEWGVAQHGLDWVTIRHRLLPGRTEQEIEAAWAARVAAAGASTQLPLPQAPSVFGALPPPESEPPPLLLPPGAPPQPPPPLQRAVAAHPGTGAAGLTVAQRSKEPAGGSAGGGRRRSRSRPPLRPPSPQQPTAVAVGSDGAPSASVFTAAGAASGHTTYIPGAALAALSDSDDEPVALCPFDQPTIESDRAILIVMTDPGTGGDYEVARERLMRDGVIDVSYTAEHVRARFEELCRSAQESAPLLRAASSCETSWDCGY